MNKQFIKTKQTNTKYHQNSPSKGLQTQPHRGQNQTTKIELQETNSKAKQPTKTSPYRGLKPNRKTRDNYKPSTTKLVNRAILQEDSIKNKAQGSR
jgi:hypothetical protein